MKNQTTYLKALCLILMVCCFIDSQAIPARKGEFTVQQPDGTSFTALIVGDEFSHRKTTLDGKRIIQDSEGYWCYAEIDKEGGVRPSRNRVGCPARTYDDPSIDTKTKSYTSQDSNTAKRLSPREKRAAFNENVLLRRNSTKSLTDNSELNVLVLLVEYKDIHFQYTKENFNNLLNQSGYNALGATGSVKDYFKDQFKGKLNFNFVVSDIVRLSKNRKEYGGNDSQGNDLNPEGMVLEACRLADNAIDFSSFSNYLVNGKHYVDYLFVFFAGGDEAEFAGDECIWSHASSVTGNNRTFDNVIIQDYACTSELRATEIKTSGDSYIASKFSFTSIGTFCHEFSHMLGLMDMYDTDYEDSDPKGIGTVSKALWGNTSLMDSGNQNNDGNTPPNYNAIDRHFLGIDLPKKIQTVGQIKLSPVNIAGEYYRLDTPDKDEYFLIECRKDEGWDTYIGNSGLLVYHIDSTSRLTGVSSSYGFDMKACDRWKYNEVNCNPQHQCADLIEANPNARNVRDVFFPYSNKNYLTKENGLLTWDGLELDFKLTDIQKNSDGTCSFNILSNSPEYATQEVFQNTAIVSYVCDLPIEKKLSFVYGVSGSTKTTEILVSAYETGKYVCRIEGLTPRQGYSVTIKDGDKSLKTISFTTNSSSNEHRIEFGQANRNVDGSFTSTTELPLVITSNMTDSKAGIKVEEIEWRFNNHIIQASPNGYYKLEGEGELKAILQLSNGVKKIIAKQINIHD